MRLDLLATLAGIMIAIQSRANGELAIQMHNGLQAALISFSSGLLLIIILSIFHPGIRLGVRNLRVAVNSRLIPRWQLLGGALGGIVIALQTQIVPVLGVASYSVAIIAGQTTVSLLVDRIGLTGGGKKMISRRRFLAAVITISAVLVSTSDRIGSRNHSVLALLLGVFGGGLIGIQRAFNGHVNEHSEQSFATSLFNFITGTTLLIMLLGISILFHHTQLTKIVNGPWWMYTGGVVGVIYIAFAATVVQHVGVLTFTLFSVGGQLIGSLVIDLISPTSGVHISSYLVTGIAMTFAGVFVAGNGISGVRKA